LWTIAEILPTMLTPGYSLYQVVWVRYGVHILVLLVALAPRQGRALFHTRRPALQVGRGLLMLIMPVSFIASLGQARASDVLAVFWLAPLLLLGFAAVLQGDRPRWPIWATALTGLLGAWLILRPSAAVLDAALFGLGMAVSFSLYVMLTRSLRGERTPTNLLYSALAVFLPLTLVMPGVWQPLTPRDAMLMAGVGLAGLGVLWALDRACSLAPVSSIACLFPLQLVAIGVALPLLSGAQPARLAILGAALIIGSALGGWLLSAPDRGVEPEPAIARSQVGYS
jgi:drug/metabolite transporter (DMT)-like permease